VKRRYYCDRYAIRNFPRKHKHWNYWKVYIDNKTNYYTLDIKLFNDMTNLGHVYVLKSKPRWT
jgi:rod shape-determining protein MreC